MAYGLNYNLQQALRDGSSLFVNIYKDGYTGTVYNYTPTSITIEPNTISDEPEPGIISSQLNVSFLLSSQADYDNFPVLLDYNDRLYYVELTRTPIGGSETVLWKGYMFNDYVNIPFSTGNLEVNITCIDALSFMKNLIYPYPDNINTTTKLKTVILTGLNWLGFPTLGDLFSTCSYYGSAMDDRADGTGYEPFDQTYIYKRDLVGKNLYDLIEQIMISFNCRLFQFQGNWWIMSANEMAKSTIYYSQYNASSNNLVASGTIANGVTIAPYTAGNVHFIDNTQNKITRKGYPIIKVDTKVEAPSSYTHNSNFKQGSTFPTGWTFTSSGGGAVTWIQNANDEFNVVRLQGGGGNSTFSAIDTFSPFVYPTTFSLSFDAIDNQLSFDTLYIRVSINNFIDSIFYLQSDGTWSFTPTNLLVDYTNKDGSFQGFSREIRLGTFDISGTNYNVSGKLGIEFRVLSGGDAYIRNARAVQNLNPAIAQSYLITRTASTAGSLTKDFTSFLGLYKADLPNIYGNLYYSNGTQITQWYSFGAAGTLFPSLPDLIARELSNLLSRNYATLEGDLGETYNAFGLIYLANTYSVTDSATNALSYNGKKFLLNRVTPNLYINQNNSLQLLEITNTNNSSTSVSQWIVS
jgi:hypothetical protein